MDSENGHKHNLVMVNQLLQVYCTIKRKLVAPVRKKIFTKEFAVYKFLLYASRIRGLHVIIDIVQANRSLLNQVNLGRPVHTGNAAK